ncbi:procathepsin L-like [Anthonomus grandis grandis]|uniref:procathepsin L-like n=1 Tax=Anthonomus grandis grandis TaxID=2921223 RepID=UPI002166047F|nr:procathepsin L-like [Anthonomus grandis grandis]
MIWLWSIITGNMNLILMLSVFLWSNSLSKEYSIELLEEIIDNRYTDDSLENFIKIQSDWERYKIEFEKQYNSPDEELKRMKTYMDNSKLIEKHNDLFQRGVYTYELGHNEFSDLSDEEYQELYSQDPIQEGDNYPTIETTYHERPLNFDLSSLVDAVDDSSLIDDNSSSNEELSPSFARHIQDGKPPFSIDWRKLGGVTPVKTEGSCGAHWAFSATGSLEGQIFRKFHRLVSLSEQNLIDCAGKKYHNNGCKNGTALNAFKYVIKNKGIDTNLTYPYKGKQQWFCKYKKLPTNPQVHGVLVLPRGNETNLAAVIAKSGPVSVAIDATGNKFRFYIRGVYNNPHCNSVRLTREMTVVGYAPNYFILKNSWGHKWGLSGYMLLGRTGHNQCGVATRAVLPLV